MLTGASVTPSMNRHASILPKSLARYVSRQVRDHAIQKPSRRQMCIISMDERKHAPPRYQEGLTLLRIIFEGICPAIYPTNKIEMRVLYSVPFKPRSLSRELSFALTRAFLSRKLKLSRN